MSIILYYDNACTDLGPTYVVPRELTRNEPLIPHIRPRQTYPELYKLERPVLAPAGSLFIYDLRTIQRGSAMRRIMGRRITHHIIYRRADAPWVGYASWANFGLTDKFQSLLEAATIRQREAFGIPPPGHPYWNAETVAGMATRYPAMDLKPYAERARVPAKLIDIARKRGTHVSLNSPMMRPPGVVR